MIAKILDVVAESFLLEGT